MQKRQAEIRRATHSPIQREHRKSWGKLDEEFRRPPGRLSAAAGCRCRYCFAASLHLAWSPPLPDVAYTLNLEVLARRPGSTQAWSANPRPVSTAPAIRSSHHRKQHCLVIRQLGQGGGARGQAGRWRCGPDQLHTKSGGAFTSLAPRRWGETYGPNPLLGGSPRGMGWINGERDRADRSAQPPG